MRALVILVSLCVVGAEAFAQGFPARPIRVIVPFPPGGGTDVVARTVAPRMSELIGQPIVVENRAGAGGNIGTEHVARSAPDGYTLLVASAATAINTTLTKNLPWDLLRDFAPVVLLVQNQSLLVAHPSVPVASVKDLIAMAQAKPGQVTYASYGNGSSAHLIAELFKLMAGVDLLHVPYKGAAPAVQDLLGGQVQMGVFDVPVLLPHIKSGKLKALAITSATRSAALPDVPTTAELGYPKVNSDNWYGLVAPAGTPADVLARIHGSATAALRSPEVIEQYGKVAGIAFPSTAAEYAAFIDSEQAKWGPVVKAIGFKQQ